MMAVPTLRILLFTQYFPPETGAAPMRAWEHARHWVRMGCQVTVVTNVPNSPRGRFYDGYRNRLLQVEEREGVRIVRVWTLPAGKGDGVARRVASFFAYLASATLGSLTLGRHDVVIASAPYLAGIPGYLRARLRGETFVYELRDPWVQVAGEGGVLRRGGLPYRMLSAVERFLATRAKEVVVIGAEMAEFLAREMRLPRMPAVVHNSCATETLDGCFGGPMLPELEGRFVAGIIGNMGSQYDLKAPLDAAEALSGTRFHLLVLGEGRQKDWLVAEVARRRLSNVSVFPPVPASEVAGWIRLCQVSIVSLRVEPIFRVYLPLKALDSLYLGVPVLVGGEGELARVVTDSGGGAVFPASDGAALAELLRARMSNVAALAEESAHGRSFVARCFTREAKAREYLAILQGTRSTDVKWQPLP